MSSTSHEIPARSPLWRLLRNRWLLAVLAAVALYTLGGFFLAPYVLERQAASWVTETLDCRLELESVRINPYTLTLDATGCALHEPDGSLILSFQRFFADLQLSSLIHGAWTFAEIQLEAPHLHLNVPAEGPPNLVRLMRKAAGPRDDSSRAEEKTEIPGLVLERIRIADGRLSLSDRSGSTPTEALIRPIHLDVRNLSTQAEQKAPYTLKAALPGGGAVTWSGRVSLFPVASQGSIVLKGLRPAVAWPFFRDVLSVKEPEGTLDAEANYRFALTPQGPDLVFDPFRISVSGLSVRLPEDENPSLQIDEVFVGPGRFDLADASLDLGSIRLERGRLALGVDAQGRLNWEDVAAGASEPGPVESEARAQSGVSPFRVEVPALEAKEIGVRFVDQSRTEPLAVDLARLDLGLSARIERQGSSIQAVVDDLRLDAEEGTVSSSGSEEPLLFVEETALRGGRFDLAERSLNLETVRLARGRVELRVDEQGRVSALAPASATENANPDSLDEPSSSEVLPFRAVVGSLSMEDMGVRFVDQSRAKPLAAEMERVGVGLSARIEWTGSSLQAVASDIRIHGTGGSLRSPLSVEPLILVAETDLRGGSFDLAERIVGVEALEVTGVQAEMGRNEDGTIKGAWLFENEMEPPASAEASKARNVSDRGTPWSLDMDSFHMDSPRIRLWDRKVGADPLYDLQNLRLDIQDLHTGSNTPFPFELRLETDSGGSAHASGTVHPGKPRVEADIQVEAVDLPPLQPYLASFLRVDLASGALSARGRIQYSRDDPETPSLSGEVSLSDILMTRAGSEEQLLAWKDAQARGMIWRPRPNGLSIDEVTFTEPSMDLVIQKDKGLDVRELLVSKSKNALSAPAEDHEPDKTPFSVEVKQVRLENGLLDFADQSMMPRFSALIHELKGTIAGLSSQSGRHAGLVLDGRVDEHGSTLIEGSVELFDPKGFTEITMHFDNVDLSHLSPYTTRFAGYRIESGKLSLDLDYAIRESRLEGKNRIVLDHLVLGERVESPDALDLRLELAVALLQDKNGRIDIGLPISGDLNNPEFSFGHIVRQALGNFLKKVITAPFRALGGLLGGRDRDLDAVEFDPGRAELPLPETEKLLQLSDALQERPRLAVEVRGAYAPEADGAALRADILRRDLAEKRGMTPAEGEPPPPLVYTDPPTQEALSDLAAERLPGEVMDALRREYGMQHGGKSPADPMGFSQSLFERLAEATPLREDALRKLARLRATAVVRELLTAGGLDYARVGMVDEVSETEAENGRIPCRLEMKSFTPASPDRPTEPE